MQTETAAQIAADNAAAHGEPVDYGRHPDGRWIIAPHDRTGMYGRDWLACDANVREVDGSDVDAVESWQTVDPRPTCDLCENHVPTEHHDGVDLDVCTDCRDIADGERMR